MSKEYRVEDTLVWFFVADSDEDAEEAREYLDLYGTVPEGAVQGGREVKIITDWEGDKDEGQGEKGGMP